MCPARSGPYPVLTEEIEPEDSAFLDEEMVMSLEITMFALSLPLDEIIRRAMLWIYDNRHNPP